MPEGVVQQAVLFEELVNLAVDLDHLLLTEAAVLAALYRMETVAHTGSVEYFVKLDSMLVGHDPIGVPRCLSTSCALIMFPLAFAEHRRKQRSVRGETRVSEARH